ncbi:MAG TPA: VCBS repeat-containing protein, partial [Planctomycetota bacterium]|nr:VCBS repeat-containing protein [Planctomycetota bacterium]
MKVRALLPLLALAAPARAQKWFDSPLVVATPTYEVRARGDLDGDGDVDLLRFYGGTSSGIWISCQALLNDGTGRFSPGPTTSLPQSQNIAIRRPLLGDVTGDGVLDLVLTVSNSPTIRGVRLFPGTGGGAFGASVFFSLPGNPIDLVLRDLDGNGALDIGVLSFGAAADPTARWLSWNGAALASSAVVSVPTLGAISLAAMDATGDGVPDLLVGEWFDPDVWVLPTVAGNPTLGSPLPIPGPVGAGRVVEAGDLDGDGDEDALVASDDYTTGLWFV